MLSNAYLLAKFRFDTAENEPDKNLQNFAKFANFADPNPLTLTLTLSEKLADLLPDVDAGRPAPLFFFCLRDRPVRGGESNLTIPNHLFLTN